MWINVLNSWLSEGRILTQTRTSGTVLHSSFDQSVLSSCGMMVLYCNCTTPGSYELNRGLDLYWLTQTPTRSIWFFFIIYSLQVKISFQSALVQCWVGTHDGCPSFLSFFLTLCTKSHKHKSTLNTIWHCCFEDLEELGSERLTLQTLN